MTASPALTPLERRVTEEVARRRDDLAGLLADLVAFDTRAPDPDYTPRDDAALQDYVAARMRAAGLAVRVWEPEPAELPATRYPIPEGHHFRGRPQLLATAGVPARGAPCSSTAMSTWSPPSPRSSGRAPRSSPRCGRGASTGAAPAT